MRAYHFDREMDELSHFHFNENRWKESGPAQTLFPELEFKPFSLCSFATMQATVSYGYARKRREISRTTW